MQEVQGLLDEWFHSNHCIVHSQYARLCQLQAYCIDTAVTVVTRALKLYQLS